MSIWTHIIETYNALPEPERISRKVHSRMLEKGHAVRDGQVRDVLGATILSEVLNEEDVRVTAKTLRTLLNISMSDVRSCMSERGEPGGPEAAFANGCVTHLWYIGGQNTSDLAQALACVLAEYQACRETDRQLDYIEQMNEFRRRCKDDPEGEDLMF
jgi:hypothetical protein